MRTVALAATVVLGLAGYARSSTASPRSAAQTDLPDFPCAFDDYRVVSRTQIRLRCHVPPQQPFGPEADIVEVDDFGQWNESTSRPLALSHTRESLWIQGTLAAGARLLESGKSYVVRTRDGSFKRQVFAISTKPVATIERARTVYVLSSRIGLNTDTLRHCELEEDPGRKLNATCSEIPAAPASRTIGQAHITIGSPGIQSLNSHLTLKGVTNVLDAAVVIPGKKRLKLPGAPKDKEGSEYYIRFLQQFTQDEKTGFAADAKLAPIAGNFGGEWFLAPQVLADVGLRDVENVKVSNTIKIGMGVTRLFAMKGPVPAVQFTPAFTFETDRDGHHKNLLADIDGRFFGNNWLHSIALQNERSFARVVRAALDAGEDPPDPASLPSARWGTTFQLFAGFEGGQALSADQVKSSDKATSVDLPKHSIARVRPKASFVVEYRRVSLSLSGTPRYLIRDEPVTREHDETVADSGKTQKRIALDTVGGWQFFGEVTLDVQLDVSGHYSLTAAYKYGAQPPNFDRVNTVQSGITMKF